MGEFNQVLWTLDRETAPQDFERLCVDLLCRDGYWKIVPIGGTNDHGRDGEAVYWRGRSERSAIVVFQFSLQDSWEKRSGTMPQKSPSTALMRPAWWALLQTVVNGYSR